MNDLEHFLRLVRQGKRRGCSSGERRAAALARSVLENVPGLDDEAIAGLKIFITGVCVDPQAGRHLVEGYALEAGRNG